jgi:hypothetical protein
LSRHGDGCDLDEVNAEFRVLFQAPQEAVQVANRVAAAKDGLADRGRVTSLGLAVAGRGIELRRQRVHAEGEHVAGVGVLRDQPQRLFSPVPPIMIGGRSWCTGAGTPSVSASW